MTEMKLELRYPVVSHLYACVRMPENRFRREEKSGSGAGTFDDMEPHVKGLEDRFLVIEIKLDRIADDLKISPVLSGGSTAT